MSCTCNEYPYILSPGEQAVIGCQSGSDLPCECVAVGAFNSNSLTFYNIFYNTICGGTTQNPNPGGTTSNPSGNGSVNYTYCYCPLSFCELAALELGDSFSGGVFGGGAVSGENDTDAGWNRNGNTWTASYNMPCGMSGTMSMECDDATSTFNFSATSSCCDSMTVSPSSSNSVQKPPEFTASSPVSNCNCPPECCHEGDCGWTSGGTTTPNPNATTTINPNATTTQNPNNTTTNPPTATTTTEDPNSGTTSAPQTTQCPCIGRIEFLWVPSAPDASNECTSGQWTLTSSCDGSGCSPDLSQLPNGTTCTDPCGPCWASVDCICI